MTLKNHIHPYLILIAGLLLLSACKKDNNQQAVVTFNLNGEAKSYDIYTSTLSTYDTLGVQEKVLTLGSPGMVAGPAVASGIELIVLQNLALPGSATLRVGAYSDALLDTTCNTNSWAVACNGFLMRYYDPTVTLSASPTDTTGNITITAFSTSPATVSGTFQWQLTDGLGYYQVTNGKFTNVPYVNE